MFRKLMKRLRNEEAGFTLIELLVTIAILGVLFGIVTLTLTGVGSSAETTVEAAELGVVQSAVDIYMADGNYATITARGTGDVIDTGDADAPFNIYLRSMPTRCDYTWTAAGVVTQSSCP
jgi:prepilin-type N-terminal cleavage/methylation domain-containing protein